MERYYRGSLRQQGEGLGGLFDIFSRGLLPLLKRTAVPLIKSQAKRLAPKLAKTGVGLLSDIARKKNLKQAVKSRGAQLIRDSINMAAAPRRPQSVKRQLNSRRPKVTAKKRKKDIFD